MLTATTLNWKNVYLLEFKKGDVISPSMYALWKLISKSEDWDKCIRVFSRE